MEINLLFYFLALTKYKNFSVAASELYLSQSSLSKRIRGLETQLGTDLFIRNTRTIELTEAGKIFLPYATKTVEEYLELQTLMKKYSTESKKMSISTVAFMSQYHILPAITSFNNQHPDIKLDVTEIESTRAIKLLDSGQTDLFIGFSPMALASKYNKYPLMKERLVLVISANHKLAKQKKVRLMEIKEEILQTFSDSHESFLTDFVVSECRNAGFEPKLSNYGLWLASIESVVQSNDCVTLLPQKIAEYFHNPKLKLVSIEDTKDFYLAVITRSDNYMSGYYLEFLQYIKSYIQ